MRIAILAPFPIDDLKKFIKYPKEKKEQMDFFLSPLVYYYIEKGHHVILITSLNESENIQFESECLDIYTFFLYKHGRIRAVLWFKAEINKIRQILLNCVYDIIHAHWCYEYAKAAIITNKEKTVITLHDWPYEIEKYLYNFYWRRKLKLGKRLLEKITDERITAVSPYLTRLLYDKTHKIAVVVPNFINKDFMRDDNKKNFYFEREKYRIISINNGFNEIKNTKVAMRAFNLLLREIPDANLYMYGDGYEQGGEAHRWAKDNGVDTNIHFVGRVPQKKIQEALFQSRVLLHTSVEESFGLIYIEAMACGTVVVAGKNSGATSWVLNEGKSGILVDIKDEKTIVGKLYEILMDDIQYNYYKENSKEWIEKMFTLESVGNAYLCVYQKKEVGYQCFPGEKFSC